MATAAFGLSAAFSFATVAALGAQRMKTLEFPADFTIGTLKLSERDVPSKRTAVGPAVGMVSVPAGSHVLLRLRNDKFVLEAIARLAKLKPDTIELLDAQLTPFSDSDCARILKLTGLTSVDVSATQVTTAGIKTLAKLPNLKALVAHTVRLDDSGCAILPKCAKLAVLELPKTPITDHGVKQLSQCSHVYRLMISRTKITDACANDLIHLKSLRFLDVSHTQFSDAGVRKLVAAKSIDTLVVNGCKVTDKSVPYFEQMPMLRHIYLEKGAFTDAALAQLHKTRPRIYLETRTKDPVGVSNSTIFSVLDEDQGTAHDDGERKR